MCKHRNITLLLCALLVVTSDVRAGLWYDVNPAIKPGIPDIGWVSTDPRLTVGGGYCGYVAAANVLTYWDNHGLPNLIEDEVTADQLMSNLIPYLRPDGEGYLGGTNCDQLENGLEKYFTDKGYGWMSITQYSPPSIDLNLIVNELKKCEQVIVGTETHWLTAVGWLDTVDGRCLGVHDPNPLEVGGVNFGGAEDYYPTSASGGLSINYGGWTLVDNIITVSIPEPCSIIIVALGTLIIRRRHFA